MGTISLAMAQSTKTYLKGSDIPHLSVVHIEVASDDGTVARILLSMDQFVRFLVSNTRVPCTLEAYRGKDGKITKEVVEEPVSIKRKMENRLGEVEQEFHQRLVNLSKTLKDIQDGHIKPGKKVIDALADDVDVLKSHHMSNREYVIERSQEELEHLASNTAAQLAITLGTNPQQALDFLGCSGQKALPAHSPVELPPTSKNHERDSREIKDMGPLQLAETIHKYLKRLESKQPPEPKDGNLSGRLFCAGAVLANNNKIMVTYVSYQSSTGLSVEEARKYAEYLAAGGKDRHFEFFRN